MARVCSRCGEELQGNDKERLRRKQNEMRSFQRKYPLPLDTPPNIRQMLEYKDALFYCEECLAQAKHWENKPCITCDFFVMNFVRMAGIPDYYCRYGGGSKAVKDPKSHTCEQWVLSSSLK